jgi:hypothetical protein
MFHLKFDMRRAFMAVPFMLNRKPISLNAIKNCIYEDMLRKNVCTRFCNSDFLANMFKHEYICVQSFEILYFSVNLYSNINFHRIY